MALLDSVLVPRHGPGRPRTRPDHLLAHKAYSHPSTRRSLRRRRLPHTITEKSSQIVARARRGAGGRPPVDHVRYKERNVVERCFARLKQGRAVVTGS